MVRIAPMTCVESLRCRPPPFSSPRPRASSRMASKSRPSAPCARRRVRKVDPCADGIGSLPVGQPFHKLQERREGEPDRRLGGLSSGREQVGEVAVLDDHVQVVVKAHNWIALRKDRPRDLRGLIWHVVCALRVERHHPPPAGLGPRRRRDAARRPSPHCRNRAEFATNIKARENQIRSRDYSWRSRSSSAPSCIASWCCQNAGSSSTRSLGSTDAEGWPRTGRTAAITHSPPSASPPSASCFESYAIQHEPSGQTPHHPSVSILGG